MRTPMWGRKRLRFRVGDVPEGTGILMEIPPDFAADKRERLATAVDRALSSRRRRRPEDIDLLERLMAALRSSNPMMEALRLHLGVDGHDLRRQVRSAAQLVREVAELAKWV